MIDFHKLDQKWQQKWEEKKIFQVKEDSNKKKFYVLEMFPYPSGAGLHMGHALNYTIGDIYARFKIMNGFNVLHPMGYDSLGLPAENAAIKVGTHPKEYTENSIKNFVKQQKSLGITYDWSRVVTTSEPEYYKWDQWIFLKMYDKGLAYKKESPVNWCPECKTVLANEQVHNGICWRHEKTNVEVKNLNQWFVKTTEYAEELNNFSQLEQWPDLIKKLQKNWIGKSHGSNVIFTINKKKWSVFTTRPDTLYGVTFLVISAQHSKLMDLVTKEQKKEVEKFVKKQRSVSAENIDQLEKEGVFTGSCAEHPLTGEKVPVYAGNFVLADYGSGMVMAVPAHDQRDFEFAKKYKIPLKVAINPKGKQLNELEMKEAYTREGTLTNSNKFNGIDNQKAKDEITKELKKLKKGEKTTTFRLRDWLISRQRYWGTPIPVINCNKCGVQPVPEKDLPVELPHNVKFGKGNPLETNQKFINTKCPKCKGKATRETDTMDTFVNSSWYHLRYADPHNSEKIFDKKKARYWNPIDLYIGGKEHACMHLIYIRFYTKFLRDLGLLNIDEPAVRLFNQGMLHGKDGSKMSKSAGNVVNLEIVEKYGADPSRFYLVSVAAPDSDFNWDDQGLQSNVKFLMKVDDYMKKVKLGKSSKKVQSKVQKAIRDVTELIEEFKYNLAAIKIRQLFEQFEEEIAQEDLESFLKLLSPFCPHLTEEYWEKLGNKSFLSTSSWPKFNAKKIDEEAEIIEEFISSATADISSVLSFVKDQKVSKATLFVAESWKYDLFNFLKEALPKAETPKDLIKVVMSSKFKSHGKDVVKIISKVAAKKMLPPYASLKKELKALEDSRESLEKAFKLKITIVKAENSKEAKAQSATPGKVGVLVE